MSHLGRPIEGQYDSLYSLEPIAKHLTSLLQRSVRFQCDWLEGIEIKPGEVVLCENVRFNLGEKNNDEVLAKKLANLCDVFVMDAFACAHRAQASTHGVACFAPVACAGLLLVNELAALKKALTEPEKPLTAIVGGSKVSTKLRVLHHLAPKVNNLIVGGGILNTFLVAAGHFVGQSLYEPDLVEDARQILVYAKRLGLTIPLPSDVVVATTFTKEAQAITKSVTKIEPDDMILDIGPKTALDYQTIIYQSKTILWNGPIGVFEFPAFANGTKQIAQAIAAGHAYSIVGGGDTLAAIEKFNVAANISYISTGGGAFLEFIEGKTLPAIEVLEQRANEVKS